MVQDSIVVGIKQGISSVQSISWCFTKGKISSNQKGFWDLSCFQRSEKLAGWESDMEWMMGRNPEWNLLFSVSG